jgi:hypothetical protein
MQKPHGPYRILAGRHVEDSPCGTIQITAIEGERVRAGDGRVFLATQGAELRHRDQSYTCYLGQRRVAPSQLQVGDEVVLAQPVVYRPGDEPFHSMHELDVEFNRGPASIKFQRVGLGESEKDREIARLHAEVAALRSMQAGVACAPAASPAATATVDLERMTFAELRAYAEAEEVQIPAKATREEALRILRQAR